MTKFAPLTAPLMQTMKLLQPLEEVVVASVHCVNESCGRESREGRYLFKAEAWGFDGRLRVTLSCPRCKVSNIVDFYGGVVE